MYVNKNINLVFQIYCIKFDSVNFFAKKSFSENNLPKKNLSFGEITKQRVDKTEAT